MPACCSSVSHSTTVDDPSCAAGVAEARAPPANKGEVHCDAATKRFDESSGATPVTGMFSLMALAPTAGAEVLEVGLAGAAFVPYRASRRRAISARAATSDRECTEVACDGSTIWISVTSRLPGTTAN